MKVIIILICSALLSALLAQEKVWIAESEASFKTKVMPFFKAYCIDCHGPKKSKGNITLHTMSGDLSSGHGVDHWENILDALKSGEMPPEDEDQPSKAERASLVQWIDVALRQYVKQESKKALPPTARRLTNFEYQNTMRDLLGFELDLTANLPVDPDKPYEFNNSAKFMLLGLEQLDRYKENARRAMASAIVDPKKPKIHKARKEWKPGPDPSDFQNDVINASGKGKGKGGPDTGLKLKTYPDTGEFMVRIKAAAILPKGISEMPLRIVMGYHSANSNIIGLQIKQLDVLSLKASCDDPQIFELRGRIENFPKQPDRSGKAIYSMSVTPQVIYDIGRHNDNVNLFKQPRAVISSIEFEAPVFETWPPKHHTDILFDSPLRKSDPQAYVRNVIERFITRAFRRPVAQEEVDDYLAIYKIIEKDVSTIEEAMRETLAMVLISPDFMYHTVGKADGANRHYEIASKLSYFIWASMPDKELLVLAQKQKLNDPKVIEEQVKRMLKDKRSKDFVKNFTVQWLSIEKMKQVAINESVYPRFLRYGGKTKGSEKPYIPTVRDYMMDETVEFVAELIKRNAPVTDIVDSNFAMLNERLAAHYGVEGVVGHKIRPVSISPEHNLGGLLTQGSVLIGNSTGTAPHPIYRAVWLREAILGDHVKEPPADVPALTDTAGESADSALSIKDLLVKHRQKESCNDCHVRLDPWGVPFERYNAIGQYQPMVPKDGVTVRGMNNSSKGTENLEQYKAYLQKIYTVKVDATSRVPHGPKVDGMKDLKKHLIKDRKDDIAKNMVSRLLTYGLGRELSYRDRYDIEKLLEQSKKNSYKLQDMIISICQSKTFTGEK